ncbi:MAG TPA: hypothetical protein VLJ68_01615 [Chitinophagaceae bacterium]|nr:hypothetical protein [Chitinophagaceae bacterium]
MKPQQQLQKLKALLEKAHGRAMTEDELIQSFWFVKRLANTICDSSRREDAYKKMLEENPKGFQIEGGFTCLVCGLSVLNENFWYDKNGIKCMSCQKALDKKLIPKSAINNKDSWYSIYDLEQFFNIDRADLTKYVKSSLLKKRIVPSDRRKPHLEIFLIKDNKDVLPPKNLLPTKLVKVMRDGEEYFTRVEWYEWVEEKKARKIRKYKISEILMETLARPIKSRKIYFRSTHPLFLIRE